MDPLVVQFRKFKENRVIRNSFYGAIQFIVPLLLLLGLTPVFIHKMGTENYGLWMVATSALGLMGIAEFGLNTAISKFVAEFVESRNTDALSAVVSTGMAAYILLGIVLIVPLYIFSPALAGIFKPSEAISEEQIGAVIRIMSLGFIPLLLRSGAMAIPVGLQRFRVPVIVIIIYQLTSYIAALAIVFLRGSVAQIVESTVAVLWITALGSLFVAWRMLQPFHLKFIIIGSREVLRRLFSFTLASGLTALGSLIFGFADRLAVGAVLGLDAVAYYTVIVSVAAKILQLSGSLAGALMPAVSTWMASGNIQRVRAYFSKATLILLGLNTLIAGTLLVLSGPLLRLWLGVAFADHVLVPFRILIVVYALISLDAPAYNVATGIGHPGINALTGITGGCLMVVLIFVLGHSLGLLGAALANGAYLVSLFVIGYVYLQINRIIKQTPIGIKKQELGL